MTFEENYEEEFDINRLREEMLAIQASNIALAAIIANLPETVDLNIEEVQHTCSVMSEMDAHTEMVTGEFVASIIGVAREIRKLNEEE